MASIETYLEKLDIKSVKPNTRLKIVGKPKLYVLSLIINSPIDEDRFTELIENFVNIIPHTDMTFNLQYADHEKINRNNRGANIG